MECLLQVGGASLLYVYNDIVYVPVRRSRDYLLQNVIIYTIIRLIYIILTFIINSYFLAYFHRLNIYIYIHNDIT